MRYRRFGKTGLAMPVISCGGMRFQFKWQDAPIVVGGPAGVLIAANLLFEPAHLGEAKSMAAGAGAVKRAFLHPACIQ